MRYICEFCTVLQKERLKLNKAVSMLMRFVEFVVTLLFAISVLLVVAQVF